MKKKKYIVITREECVYDNVKDQVRQVYPRSAVARADTLEDAFKMLGDFDGTGILLTNADPISASGNAERDRSTSSGITAPDSLRGNTKDEVGFVKMYIRLHLGEDLSLAKIAKHVNLSPNYLCVMFKKIEGISVHRFIEEQRVDRAAYLLVTEDSLTSEIGKRCGFRYSSYFCRTFQKYYHMTPRRYRMEMIRKSKGK